MFLSVMYYWAEAVLNTFFYSKLENTIKQRHVISNNVAFDKCRLRLAFAASC